MTNILKTQFYRLKKSKLFWTLFGVTAVLPLITNRLRHSGIRTQSRAVLGGTVRIRSIGTYVRIACGDMLCDIPQQRFLLRHFPKRNRRQPQQIGAVSVSSAHRPDDRRKLYVRIYAVHDNILRRVLRLRGYVGGKSIGRHRPCVCDGVDNDDIRTIYDVYVSFCHAQVGTDARLHHRHLPCGAERIRDYRATAAII